ncbi:hypothetical protein [Allohahella sp. A8]|uniref:hypothetical protein n=1 Tax=Allohahella sp. A8 TaxID=3141461 RepID=UPI003A7FD8A1
MSNTAMLNVWLVRARGGRDVAFADVSLKEYVADATLLPVPLAPPSCKHVLEWQGVLAPVFQVGRNANNLAHVLLLQAGEEAPLIGLAIRSAPQRITIKDDDVKGFQPSRCGFWKDVLLSGFVHEGESVPIIDPALMCDARFVSLADRALYPTRNRA